MEKQRLSAMVYKEIQVNIKIGYNLYYEYNDPSEIMRKNIFTSYEQYSRYSESLERSFERLIDVRSYCNRTCKNILIH